MTAAQKFFLWLLPAAWGQAMAAESKQWKICCPACDFEISVWDAGGIRFKATGHQSVYRKCPGCGQRVWMRLEKIIPR